MQRRPPGDRPWYSQRRLHAIIDSHRGPPRPASSANSQHDDFANRDLNSASPAAMKDTDDPSNPVQSGVDEVISSVAAANNALYNPASGALYQRGT